MKFVPVVLLSLLTCLPARAVDRSAFRFDVYNLEMRLDPAASAITARGRIVLRNESNQPQRDVALQISSSLEWRLIEVVGSEKPPQYIIQNYTTDVDHTGAVTEAIVTLPKPVAPRGEVELDIGYSGDIKADATRLTRTGTPEAISKSSDWDQLSATLSAVRGPGHVVWYPISMDAASLEQGDLFAQLATWNEREAGAMLRTQFCWIADMEEDSDQQPHLMVVANGRLQGLSQKNEEPGTEGARTGCSTYDFRLGRAPATFAIGDFQSLERAGVNVFYLGNHKQLAADYAYAGEKVEPVVSDWLGTPSEKVQIVELNDPNAFPFEAGSMLFTPLHALNESSLELQLAHQFAHASVHSTRGWIDEGLAEFMQAVVRERQDGRKAAIEFMRRNLPALVEVESTVAVSGEHSTPAQPLLTAYDEIYIRVKAMYVWWMLRDMIGDIALQKAIKSYDGAEDKHANYLQRLFESTSKKDLEWFFDGWVYRDRGLPDFQIDSAYPRVTLNGTNVVTVTVEDTRGVGAEVPVRAQAGLGEVSKRLQVLPHEKAVLRLEVPTTPDDIVVNDGSVPEANTKNNVFKITKLPETPATPPQ